MRIDVPDNAVKLMQKLIDNGFEAYIVGGYCRSMIMREQPKDVDIFTNAHGHKILEIFPQGKVLGNEERQAKILTVIVDDIEVSTYRKDGKRKLYGNTIQEHQETSDLTINNICCDLNGVIDLNNKHNKIGLDDIGIYDFEQDIWQNEMLIKFVGNPEDRIKEDNLRILRAIRFSSQYNAKFDKDSLEAIKNNNNKLHNVAKERIRDELVKCLKYNNCMDVFVKTNTITHLFPGFHKVIDMKGGDHHNETVDEHMMNAYKVACSVTNDWRVRLAAFMHDIGKGVTCSIVDGKLHFYQHEKEGYIITKEWMTKMKFSKDDVKFVSTLIKYHMWSYKTGDIKKKSYLKMFNKFRDAGVSIYDFITVIYADHQGNEKKERIKYGDFIAGSWILKRFWECVYTKEPFSKKDLELQGGDIIKIVGKEPGKWVSIIMDKILDEIMEDNLINDRTSLVKYVKNNYTSEDLQ